jgi:Tol biopolymer transport system component
MGSESANEVPWKFLKHLGRRRLLKLLWGLPVLGLITLLCLGSIVSFVLISQVTGNIDSVKRTLKVLTEKPVYNQITFVGNDGNLWLVSPDGTGLHRITNDSKGYTFPTWAPDGRHLAFIGPDAQDNPALYVTPADEAAPTILFNKSNSSPFYLYWSPDSRTITFLTQEVSGLAMRQADVNIPDDQRLLGMGAPFYWVWSPDGDKLLMHVGGARAFSDEAHLSILENQKDTTPIQLDLAPGRFQAPVWSSDGSYFYYVATTEEGDEAIYRTNAKTLAQEVLTKLTGFSNMALSPDGQHLSYIQIERNDRPPFGTAYIVDTTGNNHRRLTDRLVGSMYWSPDGSKLALLTISLDNEGPTAKADGLAAPLPQKAFLRWWIYYLETDELEPLISFSPTIDFLQTIPYFDQYHLSLTFWSPDSQYLVITKAETDNDEGTIWVVDTTGQEDSLQVGEGKLAVWSWR